MPSKRPCTYFIYYTNISTFIIELSLGHPATYNNHNAALYASNTNRD